MGESRSRKPRTGPLSSEDAALWDKVARTARPLHPGRTPDQNAPTEEVETPAAEEADRAGRGERAAGRHTPSRPQPSPPEPPEPPPLGGFDRREAKQLGTGRLGIEARIDLHGMRQREAHAALRAFLARAHGRGQRHVLVITGKGGARTPESGEPGVLRREVPRWLGEPAFRQWVVSYTRAAPRHGGEGALYVRLRKTGGHG